MRVNLLPFDSLILNTQPVVGKDNVTRLDLHDSCGLQPDSMW